MHSQSQLDAKFVLNQFDHIVKKVLFYFVNLLSVTNLAHDSTVFIFGFESVFANGKIIIILLHGKGILHM